MCVCVGGVRVGTSSGSRVAAIELASRIMAEAPKGGGGQISQPQSICPLMGAGSTCRGSPAVYHHRSEQIPPGRPQPPHVPPGDVDVVVASKDMSAHATRVPSTRMSTKRADSTIGADAWIH